MSGVILGVGIQKSMEQTEVPAVAELNRCWGLEGGRQTINK